MYINYINDRQELGFSCIKDVDAIKELSNLKSSLKNPVSWVIRKGKQSVVLIFSKEVLVAVLIYVESISGNINPNLYDPSFSSSEVYQSSVGKPDNFVFLTASLQIPDFILKLKGGSDELTNEEQERLVKSILAKVSESNYQETSPNKFLKRVLNLMDPVISNQRLWRVLSELEKLWKPELSDGNHISSRAQTVENKEPKSKGSSSIFAEALPIPTPRKLSPMRTRVLLDMSEKENNFSTQLESSGLSKTHGGLSEKIRSIEMKTRVLSAQPLYPSQVLGDSYQYGGKQLARKAPRHLIDFGISTEGKTVEEMSMEYKDVAEMLLSKPKLVIHEEGTLNKQEPTINIGEPESLGIVSFENNPLYDKHHFISCYIVSQKAFDDFVETGEIGISPEERKMKIDAFQKKQAQAEREKKMHIHSTAVYLKMLVSETSNWVKLKLLNRS